MSPRTTTAGEAAPFRLLPTTRIEAFSDGVFAIVITLLVLELEVPDASSQPLRELAAGWAGYLGYVVSFAFIGGVWMSHAKATRFMVAADDGLMRLNLVLLLFVSFLPFSTSLLTTHLKSAGASVAVIVFGINLTAASLMMNLLLRYLTRSPGIVADAAADAELAAFEKEKRAAAITLGIATVVGLVLPLAAVGFYLVISLLVLAVPVRRSQGTRSL